MRNAGMRMVLCGALVIGLAACDSTGPTRTGTAHVALATQSEAGAPSEGTFSLMTADGSAGNVSLAAVANITLELMRVEATRNVGDDEGTSGWFALELQAPGSINLLQLPSEEETGLLLARGELEPGAYTNVRLFFVNATITFNQPVTLGSGPAAVTYEADVAHSLRVPSGAQTGVKVPTAGFTIAEDEESTVVLVFDPATSVQSISATPNFLIMSPVLTAQVGD
jgi:hypothetical protein